MDPLEDFDTLGDLLARDRRTDDPAVRVDGDPPVGYTYADFLTTAWKTAGFFRHRGVHAEATVAVVDDRAVPPLLAFFGAVQLGAVVRFGPPETVDARLLVGSGERVLDYDLPPRGTRVAYSASGAVDDPTVEPFGRSVPSENPVEPPESVEADVPALATEGPTLTHEELLTEATAVADSFELGGRVAVRAPLSDPRTVVAGVVAPLLAGGTVVFPDAGRAVAVEGGVAVADGPVPESRTVELSGVPFGEDDE